MCVAVFIFSLRLTVILALPSVTRYRAGDLLKNLYFIYSLVTPWCLQHGSVLLSGKLELGLRLLAKLILYHLLACTVVVLTAGKGNLVPQNPMHISFGGTPPNLVVKNFVGQIQSPEELLHHWQTWNPIMGWLVSAQLTNFVHLRSGLT